MDSLQLRSSDTRTTGEELEHRQDMLGEVIEEAKNRGDSPIITGMQIHHNYIRTHMGLNGDTPADRAGIKINGKNKWITIIQNASQ